MGARRALPAFTGRPPSAPVPARLLPLLASNKPLEQLLGQTKVAVADSVERPSDPLPTVTGVDSPIWDVLAAIDTVLVKLVPLSSVGAKLACSSDPNPFWTLTQLLFLTDRLLADAGTDVLEQVGHRRLRHHEEIDRLRVIATTDEHGRLVYGVLNLDAEPNLPACPDYPPE